MRNLFKDAMYLFDMELNHTTIIESKKNKDYKLYVLPDYEEACIDGFHIDYIGVELKILIYKNDMIIEGDVFNGSYCNSKYFFDYLRWFHDDPEHLIQKFYREEISIKTRAEVTAKTN